MKATLFDEMASIERISLSYQPQISKNLIYEVLEEKKTINKYKKLFSKVVELTKIKPATSICHVKQIFQLIT